MHDDPIQSESARVEQQALDKRVFSPFATQADIVDTLIREIEEGAYLSSIRVLREFGKEALAAVPAIKSLLASQSIDDFARFELEHAVQHSDFVEDAVQAAHPAELFSDVLVAIAKESPESVISELQELILSDCVHHQRAAACTLSRMPSLVDPMQESIHHFLNGAHKEMRAYELESIRQVLVALSSASFTSVALAQRIFSVLPDYMSDEDLVTAGASALQSFYAENQNRIDCLQERLTSSRVEDQIIALRVILDLGPDAEQIAESVHGLFQSADLQVQALAIEAFGAIGCLRYLTGHEEDEAKLRALLAELEDFASTSQPELLRVAAKQALSYFNE